MLDMYCERAQLENGNWLNRFHSVENAELYTPSPFFRKNSLKSNELVLSKFTMQSVEKYYKTQSRANSKFRVINSLVDFLVKPFVWRKNVYFSVKICSDRILWYFSTLCAEQGIFTKWFWVRIFFFQQHSVKIAAI